MRSARSRSSNRGTSILEALAAIGVIGVAMIGLVTGTVSTTRANKASDCIAAATALAQQQLENLRSMPLGAAGLAAGAYGDPANPMKADGSAGGRFSRSWVVSAGNTPRAGLKTVTVSVSWTDSRPHTTRLAAYVRCSTIPCS